LNLARFLTQLVNRRLIGLQGFEPWTSPTRTARSTKLSHSPNKTDLTSTRAVGQGMGLLLCHVRRGVQA
jgi:hypothetical protein